MSTVQAGVAPLEAYQGATWEVDMTYRDSAGAIVNLSGYTAQMQVRSRTAATTVDLTLSTANGRITLGSTSPNIVLAVAAADMTLSGTYVYDLKLTQGSDVTVLLRGDLTVSPAVTR